jgi:hypothetical protein
MLDQVVSSGEPVEVEVLAGRLRSAAPTAPFSEVTRSLLREFSKRLRAHPAAKAYPEVQALAFSIRPAWINELHREWDRLADDFSVLVPRGLAFHVPPGNVDTVFIYSWALSALVGNTNVVRLPSTATDQVNVICEVLGSVLESDEFTSLRPTAAFVRYGHDDDVTAALSKLADVRVVWGGDETVSRIRRLPLSPATVEMTFPDRFSLVAFDAPTVTRLGDSDVNWVGRALYNDVYWFNQLGCSSPRLVIWRGEAEQCIVARDRVYQAVVRACDERGYETPLSAHLAKLGFAFNLAAEGSATSIRYFSNEATVVELCDLSAVRRTSPGGGFFLDVRVDTLLDLVDFVARKDQTLTHFGFERADLVELVAALNGRGIDRLVPVGQAMTFSRYWDGYDLLQAFSRRVQVLDVHRAAPASS